MAEVKEKERGGSLMSERKGGRMGVCLTSEETMVVGSQEELVSLLRVTIL